MGHVRHLYVHLPFCAHRCGYCDFVTVVGRRGQHASYVDALLAELDLEGSVLAEDVETVFLGGGTPTFTHPPELARLLEALPAAREVTVEANPETVTPELAALLQANGVTRVSLGAQSFQPHLLEVLERRASPEAVRRSVRALRGAGFDNVSLDLLYGIPGQGTADLDADLAQALALEPEHLSCYELEAMPGTRFTHAHGDELERQAEAMEGYFEKVVDTVVGSGYRWYETANFCLDGARAAVRDLRAHHNLGYWQGRDYLGVGVGAVSTVAGERRRNLPSISRYAAALADGHLPPREIERIDHATRDRELLLLGLRLDEPVVIADVGDALDLDALDRLVASGLVERSTNGRGEEMRLTRRGRFLGGGVTAELLAR
ncbi:MAG TPA: radical SAM family heme chaperone HemW [Gaiellaceae bacterium]|nr:radical SAM family heme chaperone HemW [Gaiellaceae bacterium]